MSAVKGIGWIGGGHYGCVRKAQRTACEGPGWMGRQLFAYPFKNFGRLDDVSRNVCHAVALAMRDADITYSMGYKQAMGIIGTNVQGSFGADRAYFKDYLEGGRTLGRGNLFIYTLPSSPPGEAAIHFGLLGPMFYMAGGGLAGAMALAGDIVQSGECSSMLVGEADKRGGIYFVLQAAHEGFMDTQQIMGLLDRGLAPSDLVTKIQSEVLKA